MIRTRRPFGPALPLLAFLLAGCGEDPVSYRVGPRETAAPSAQTTLAANPATTPGPTLEWTAPEAWDERPPSEMRLASYAFTAADGSVADISVFAFPDAAGGLLANINRWRGQVGLEAVAPDALESTATRTEIIGQVAWLVDFAGSPDGSAPMMGSAPAPTGVTRIVGAIIPISGKAWFFKMMGPDAVVVSQRDNFDQLIRSIRAVTPAGPPPAAAAAAAASNSGDPHAGVPGAPALGSTAMDPSMIAAPPPPAGFSFATPTGWEPQPSSQFRLASFKVPGPGVPAADVSVTNFPGSVGGDFANINRWRQQLGLGPMSEAELATATHTITGKDAQKFVVVEIESEGPAMQGGHKARMLAAILKQPESTWFFKMTGESAHVATQRDAFEQFLQSFHLDDGHAH